VVALAVFVTCLPGASAIIAWRAGWVPVSDWAVPVVFGWDTFGAHPRVIGQWTSLSRFVSKDLYQPGPLQFWLLAIPERIFAPSPAGALVGSALVSTGAVLVLFIVAWRRGGTRMLAATTLVAALLLHGLGAEVLRDPYNPSIAAVCFIAYLAAAWAVVDDDRWFWPVAIAFGSVSAQTHVTYLVPLSTIGLVMVIATVRNVRAKGPGARWWKVGLTSSVVTLACWSGPLLNQFFGSGNLFALVGAGFDNSSHPAGYASGVRRLLDQLMIPPNWLTKAFVDLPAHRHPMTPWPMISAIVVGVFLIWSIWRAFRHRDSVISSAGVVSVAAAIGAMYSAARLPIEGHASQASTNRFFWWPIGAMFWLVIGWTLIGLVAGRVRRRRWAPPSAVADPALVAVAVVVVVISGALVVMHGSPKEDPASSSYGEVAAFTEAATPICKRASGPVAVDGDLIARAATVGGLTAMLSFAGCEVHTSDGRYYGFWRVIDDTEPVTMYISSLPKPKEGYRRVATYDGTDPPAKYRDFTKVGLFMRRRVVHLDVLMRPEVTPRPAG
jgi:hypothetical protein